MDAYRVAFNTWQEKTEWVQKDKRFDVLLPWGKHRADVLKEYIDHLEARCAARLDELEAAEKRIAALEAREVVLPQRYSMLHRVGFDEPYHTEMVYKQHQVLKALHDAGVNVAAAAGKGE